MFLVKVCATSANVCVGFDVLGLALNLTNDFTFEKSDKFEFTGFDDCYSNCKNNLVYYAYERAFKYAKKEIIPVKIGIDCKIPVSRGLGSSSSLIVAGVYGANLMMGNILSTKQIFNLCTLIEGHPDNVAPAIFGGLVASYKNGKYYKSINYPVSKKLKFTVIIPPYKLSTHEAREALPKELGYEAIVNNLSRIVNIPYAFKKGNVRLLKELFNDSLHEPYRGALIKDYKAIKEELKNEKVAFAISGSGSTMIAISYDTSFIDKLNKYDVVIKTLEVGSKVEIKEI